MIYSPGTHHPLNWTCHVCGEERPDAQISVLHRTAFRSTEDSRFPVYFDHNVRYCNDKVACSEGAWGVRHFESVVFTKGRGEL